MAKEEVLTYDMYESSAVGEYVKTIRMMKLHQLWNTITVMGHGSHFV